MYKLKSVDMVIKLALLLGVILAGCNAFPKPEVERDMSIFFEHVDPEARIVGGQVAANGAHPHMGALTNGANVRSFICGSAIITRRTVVTAAHCIVAVLSGNTLSSSFRMTVGTNTWNSGGETYSFQRHFVHPSYNSALITNDLGMLHTSANIVFHNRVRVIPINYDFVGARVNVRVAGWGRIRGGGPISANLLQLNTVTVDGNACVTNVRTTAQRLNMWAPPVVPSIQICTFLAVNRGTCNGDSGSALVRTDRMQMVGVVSWGLPCALGAPDMYVRLSAFRGWIQGNTLT